MKPLPSSKLRIYCFLGLTVLVIIGIATVFLLWPTDNSSDGDPEPRDSNIASPRISDDTTSPHIASRDPEQDGNSDAEDDEDDWDPFPNRKPDVPVTDDVWPERPVAPEWRKKAEMALDHIFELESEFFPEGLDAFPWPDEFAAGMSTLREELGREEFQKKFSEIGREKIERMRALIAAAEQTPVLAAALADIASRLSVNPAHRRIALTVLGHIRDGEAIDALVKILRVDPNARVRVLAGQALACAQGLGWKHSVSKGELGWGKSYVAWRESSLVRPFGAPGIRHGRALRAVFQALRTETDPRARLELVDVAIRSKPSYFGLPPDEEDPIDYDALAAEIIRIIRTEEDRKVRSKALVKWMREDILSAVQSTALGEADPHIRSDAISTLGAFSVSDRLSSGDDRLLPTGDLERSLAEQAMETLKYVLMTEPGGDGQDNWESATFLSSAWQALDSYEGRFEGVTEFMGEYLLNIRDTKRRHDFLTVVGRPSHPGLLPYIETMAQSDPDPEIRKLARERAQRMNR